jgi:hypothetical protein
MKFNLEHEVDRGPIVRWIANKAMDASSWLAKVSHPYADMYTAVWDDYEDEDSLSEPYNQMGLFEDLEVLPQFEKIDRGLL